MVLDSGAAISVMSPQLLDDIHECPAISITGVTTDPLVLHLKRSLGGLIDVHSASLWYHIYHSATLYPT